MSAISIRRLTQDDWVVGRDVRLAALTDAPEAFASTLAREVQFSEQTWRERLSANCCAVAFEVADGDEAVQPVGIAGGYAGESGAELVSMWVAPDARGRGTAGALIAAVCDWAAQEGHVSLALWVVEGNTVAERVYARNGFVRSGRVQPVRRGDSTVEFEMIRLLPAPETEVTPPASR